MPIIPLCIEFFHTSVGHVLEVNDRELAADLEGLEVEEGTVGGYLQLIAEFATLRRVSVEPSAS